MPGLDATFAVFAKTDNHTAVRVLMPALNSPRPAIQEGALVSLLKRHELAGHREILARISHLPHTWKNIIREHSDRLTSALRLALVEPDESLSMNACRAAVMFADFNVIPALLSAIENGSQNKANMAVEALMQLVAMLYDELQRSRDRGDNRDPQWSRQHVLASLETGVQRFGRHRRREVLEAFLLLADRENKLLNQILHNPHNVSFLIVIDVLSKSEEPGVMQLLLSYLEDPHAPFTVLNAISNRGDPKFVRHLLRCVGMEPSDNVRHNLKRIQRMAWLKTGRAMLDYLDNSAQRSVVQLLRASGIPREQTFATIAYLLQSGKPAGRREAALALSEFNGAEANAIALKALQDSDPYVQANILTHIRRRGIPGILPRLMKLIDSPHFIVRRAVQQSLSEYTFPRLVGNFEMLDEDSRQRTAMMVQKVDPQTMPLLREELLAPISSRRIRGLQIARILDVADSLGPTIVGLLRHDDPNVREEAARTLAECKSPVARRALEDALQENRPSVGETERPTTQEGRD